MKTSIPADVWEKKKDLIARLYKDEEWPLKQVIKRIRTAEFNPSETQLRSRLKKWRVTKPSRQTRKKPVGEEEDDDDDNEDSEESPRMKNTNNNNNNDNNIIINNSQNNHDQPRVSNSNTTSPAAPMAMPALTPPSQPQPDLALTREWYPADVWQHDQVATQAEQSWTAPSPLNHTTPEQTINTPVVTQFPAHAIPAYDYSQPPPPQPQPQQQQQQQPSPPNTISPVSIPTTISPTNPVLSPAYVPPTYAMPLSYPQSAPWPSGSDFIEPDTNPATMALQPSNWYASLYDVSKVTAPPPGPASSDGPPYYTSPRSMNTFHPVHQHISTPELSFQAQTQAQAQLHQQQQPLPPQQQPPYQPFPDNNMHVRPWRRATTAHYTDNPSSAPLVRVDRQGRQRKAPEQKRKDAMSPMQQPLINPAYHPQPQQQQQHHHLQQQQHHPQYIAAGHHPHLIPHDMYAYAGHEQQQFLVPVPRPMGH